MSEADLAATVVKWLTEQHWDVYQEVTFGGASRADIVAVRNGYLWIIETKMSLTLTVLGQANGWRSHFRSVAVPRSLKGDAGRCLAYDVARDYLKVGVIEVDGVSGTRELINAPVMREYHRFAKKMINKLRPEHKTYLAAGSNGGGYFTPYRETMDHVKRFILAHPGCTINEIMADVGRGHYSRPATAKSCIRSALSQWESSWCETGVNDRGAFTYYVKAGK